MKGPRTGSCPGIELAFETPLYEAFLLQALGEEIELWTNTAELVPCGTR